MSECRKLIIIGGGEHAGVVADAVQSAASSDILGFVDSVAQAHTILRTGLRQFSSDEEALGHVAEAQFVLGIGRIGLGARRRTIVERYSLHGARWFTVIHASAWVSPTATLKAGAVILAGAVVNTNAVVGAHCIVNSGAIIEHDVQLGDYSVVAPGAVVGGGVQIEDDCYLGLGCRVRDHVSIGHGSVVGMGAVLVNSLPAGVEAIGIPARVR